MIYDYEQDQVISSKGLLALLGVPIRDLKTNEMTHTDLSSLAGEAMFAGSIGSLMLSVYLNSKAAWWCE
jgi:hypothetical protein